MKFFLFFKKIFRKINYFFQSPYFGFIEGHDYINSAQINKLRNFVGVKDLKIEKSFEDLFAKKVGDGFCISYASARMGFYELMVYKKIKKNDEIIILGATCAVMINAILRIKAKPIFSDIDRNTFGTEIESIKNKISNKTKMIVAQHSFGIPCNIKPIIDLAKKEHIFVLEDCALSFGSSIGGIKVGNFGDAALFSTDHTKPINTLTGGQIYSKNIKLIKSLRNRQKNLEHLNIIKQKALWNRFLFERKFCNPRHYGKLEVFDYLLTLKKKLFHLEEPFLLDDFYSFPGNKYQYPSKMPVFLSLLGILELKRWAKVKKERRNNFKKLNNLFNSTGFYKNNYYNQSGKEIVGLRYAGVCKNKELKLKLEKLFDTKAFWFKKPIIGAMEPLKKYFYKSGMSSLSEKIGPQTFNIPCNLNKKEFSLMYKKLTKILKNN